MQNGWLLTAYQMVLSLNPPISPPQTKSHGHCPGGQGAQKNEGTESVWFDLRRPQGQGRSLGASHKTVDTHAQPLPQLEGRLPLPWSKLSSLTRLLHTCDLRRPVGFGFGNKPGSLPALLSVCLPGSPQEICLVTLHPRPAHRA